MPAPGTRGGRLWRAHHGSSGEAPGGREGATLTITAMSTTHEGSGRVTPTIGFDILAAQREDRSALPRSEPAGSEPSHVAAESTPISLHTGDGVATGSPVLAESGGLLTPTAHGLGYAERCAEADEAVSGVLQNRSKLGDSPFVPIVKTPTFAQNSGNLTGYAVEIADANEASGYRHVGNVSEGYLLLRNLDVRELALEIARRSGLDFTESKVFWDGSRFAHVIDFDQSEEVSPGDGVGLSLITRSSYDKSWRFDTQLMGKRFLCMNGMLTGEFFARVAFKHVAGRTSGEAGSENTLTIGHETWEDAVLQGLSVMEHAGSNLKRFVRGLRRLHGQKMDDALLRDVWAHLDASLPKLGDGLRGKIMSKYLRSEDPTLYGLLNAGTHETWHAPRMNSSDFATNDAWTTAFLHYAFDHVN